jgi:hypothetical protein
MKIFYFANLPLVGFAEKVNKKKTIVVHHRRLEDYPLPEEVKVNGRIKIATPMQLGRHRRASVISKIKDASQILALLLTTVNVVNEEVRCS